LSFSFAFHPAINNDSETNSQTTLATHLQLGIQLSTPQADYKTCLIRACVDSFMHYAENITSVLKFTMRFFFLIFIIQNLRFCPEPQANTDLMTPGAFNQPANGYSYRDSPYVYTP